MNDASKVTFRFSDAMPNICVVCGAKANGSTLLCANLPMDSTAKQMTILQIFSLFFGFFLFWYRKSPGYPSERMVSLPTCDRHSSAASVSTVVTVTAVDFYSAELYCPSTEFRNAFEKIYAPPSPELFASLDTGKPKNTSDFLGELSKSDIQSPSDFLKGLERND